MSIEERVAALESRVDELTRHPVREELLSMRDVYGVRLDAIDARLRSIEFDLSETNGWIERRFGDVDGKLDEVLAELRDGR